MVARLLTVVIVATALVAGAPGVAGAQTAGQGPGLDPGAWTVYHHDPAGSGTTTAAAAVDTASRVWTSPVLAGQLYGEPLVVGGRVFVATEADTVTALSGATGAVIWSTHLGTPVPAGLLPCGDIAPTVGVTGTPVLDTGSDELFVVADELVSGRPTHRLIGLDAGTGRVEVATDVDPPGADPAAILQRTGLTLAAGQVVFGFGGNYGDCATYQGWVVAVGERGGTPRNFAVDDGPGELQGAVWMGGAAPTVDAAGDIWVSTGNGSVTSPDHPYDDSDSVLELSASLQLLQFFAPTTWASDNRHDLDFSMAPVLLAGDQVVIAGKSRIAYLLDGSHLDGIGGQLAKLPAVCSQDVDGGAAVVGSTVYLPCESGTVALQVTDTPPGLRLVWRSAAGGGPPIVAGGLVWTIGQDGTLSGLDPATGEVRQQASVGVPANHFPTPSVGDGLLLAPSADQVVAFRALPPGAPVTGTTGAGGHRPSPPPAVAGGLSPGALADIVVGALVVVGGIGWVVRRRARLRSGQTG